MNNQYGQMSEEQAIALQASGEYMMNHIADVMEMVQDIWARHEKSALNETTLIIVEAEVKAIAETLTQQASKPTNTTTDHSYALATILASSQSEGSWKESHHASR